MKEVLKKVYFSVILTLVLSITSVVYAANGTPLGDTAGTASLGFEAYNCSNYISSDEDKNGMYDCLDAYLANELSTYRLVDNSTIDKSSAENGNKYIMLIANINQDLDNKIDAINYRINYNDAALTLLSIEGEKGYAETNDYPHSRSGNYFNVAFGNPTYTSGDTSVKQISYAAYTATANQYIYEKQNLAYHFLKVNENATSGATLAFSYGAQPLHTDASKSVGTSKVRVDMNQETLTLKVSGGTTSDDNTLKSAVTSHNGTVYVFSSDTPFTSGSKLVTEYMTYVPSDVTDIDFNLIANNAGATIAGEDSSGNTLVDSNNDKDKFVSEDNTLKIGLNTYTITVIAADATPEVYTFNVYRLSNDATLSSLTADGIDLTVSGDGLTYSGLTTYADDSTTIYATPNHPHAKVASGAGSWTFTNSGTTANVKKVLVQAENCSYTDTVANATCTTKEYTVSIQRTDASSDATLSEIKTGYNTDTPTLISGFSSSGKTYNLGQVANNIEKIKITAKVTDTGKAEILSGTGTFNLVVGQNTFEIKTVAEDGVTKDTYTIKVYRKSNNKKLASSEGIVVSSNPSGTLSPAYRQDYTGRYTYSYDPTVTSVKVKAKVDDIGKAKINIVDATDGLPADVKTNAAPNNKEETFTTPTTKIVAIVVVSENDETETYYIDLTRNQSNTNTLSNLVVEYQDGETTKTAPLTPSFSASNRPYTVSIPADVDTVKIKPTKTSEYSSVISIGSTAGLDLTEATVSDLQFGANPQLTIKVVSETNNDNEYYLTITREKYNIKTLDSLTLGTVGNLGKEFSGTDLSYTYSETLPYTQTTLDISGVKTNKYATVQVSITDENNNTVSQTITQDQNRNFSGTLNIPTGQSTIGILVTAHNGTDKQTYQITVNRNKNSDSTVKSLRVDGQVSTPTYDDVTKTYSVTVPFNTVTITPAQVAVEANDTAKAIVTKGSSVTDLSTTEAKTFTFRVTAENTTYTDYYVNIIKKANDKAVMTRATAKIGDKSYYCDVDQTTKTCTISVPVATTTFKFYTTRSENSTVTPVDGTEITLGSTESDKDINVRVTSEDTNAYTDYVIKVERAKSSDNFLSDLTVNGDTVADFSSSGNAFTDTEGGATSSINVVATVNDTGKAKVTTVTVNSVVTSFTGDITDGIYSFSANLLYGTNTIVITVEAENRQPQRHTLTVTRQKNETPTINKLEVGVSSETPTEVTTWNKDSSTHTLTTVGYNDTSITIIAYPEDTEYGTAKITEVKNEKNQTTSSNIENLNTEGNVYKATIPLSTGTNTITLVGYAHNTSVSKTYTITIVRNKNSANEVTNLKVKNVEVVADDEHEGEYKVTLGNSITSITSSDITYTLPDGAAATTDFTTKELSTKTNNQVKLTITSENGTPNVYVINVKREKSSNADLSRVTLKIVSTDTEYNGNNYSCNFDSSDQASCTIDVPSSTTGYQITSTLADGEATVNPANGTTDTMSATESTKTIDVYVTPEIGGEPKHYTVLVRRAKSTITNLASLTVDGTSVNNFKPEGTIYYVTVDGDTEEVTVAATVQDTGKAKIKTDLSNPIAVDFGQNNIEILVEAEDTKVTKTVTVVVTRSKRKDATLKDIYIDGNNINSYNIERTEDADGKVTIKVKDPFLYDKTEVNITADKNDTNASVTSGVGTNSLSTGNNHIVLHVFAHDTTVIKDYELILTRNRNSSTDLSKITLADVEATYKGVENGDKIYEVTVPNSVSEANHDNLIITPASGQTSNDPLAETAFTDTALSTKQTTDIRITVTAEDTTVDTKVILRVTREKSDVATLKALSVVNGSFKPSFVPNDKTKNQYTVSVPEDQSSITIAAETTDPEATIVTGTGTFNLSATNTSFQIHVRSEDLNQNVYYTLNVERAKSTDNTLKLVRVSSGEDTTYKEYKIYDADNNTEIPENGFASVSHYKVTVPGEIDVINLYAETTDLRASIDNVENVLGNKIIPVGNTTVNIKVRSEKGETQTYSIVITREKKGDNTLSGITINGEELLEFDPEVSEYTLPQVDNDIATLTVAATPNDEDAQVISGTGIIDLATGDNKIRIVVKAQNGNEKSYEINVNRKMSDDNRLSSLSVNSYQMTPAYSYVALPDEEVRDYYVTINYDKDTFSRDDVYARAHNNTATVTYSEAISINNGETKSFNIYVLSESGNTNTYTIHVTRALSNNAYLKSVTVKVNDKAVSISPAFTKTRTEYTISIPYGADKFTISGEAEIDSTTIQYNNSEYNVETTDEVRLVTHAQIYDPNGTEEQRNATMTYKFTVVKAQSNNAYLASLNVQGFKFVGERNEFSQAYTDYDIGDIDSSVTGLIINAVPENIDSSVYYKVNTGTESENNVVSLPSGIGAGIITIRVLAPDGLTEIPYTISYNKVYSTNNYLASLTTSEGTLSPTFIKTTREYLLSIDSSVSSLDLEMYTESRLANVKINDSQTAVSATDIRPYTYTVENIPTGDTTITILVSAQDTTKAQTYTVVIRKAAPAANSDATLSSLEVVDYPFVASGSITQTTFSKDVTNYSIGRIPFSVDKLKVNYRTTQGESITNVLVGGASVNVDADGYIPIPKADTDNGIITIIVTAPNLKTTKTYNVHYSKKGSTNAQLSNIVVSNGALSPAFSKDHDTYTVTLDEGVTSETITVTLDDPTSTLVVAGQERVSPYAHVLNNLGSGTYTATFLVTSESGSLFTYYVNVIVPSGEEFITSVNFGHVIENGYIKSVRLDETAGTLKDELDNENSKLEIWDASDTSIVNDTDKLATGMIAKLKVNGEEKDRKVIVIKGDVNGDGGIDLFDAIPILNHYLRKTMLTGAYEQAAYTTDGDSDIDLFDAIMILNHYLGKSSLH